MPGIVFFRTTMLQQIVEFYVSEVGMYVWLEQADCVILSHGNLLVGFCQRETPEVEGMITFFYPTKEDVDAMYSMLSHIATSEPKESEKYEIYQFFAQDPESRAIEFQSFLRPIEPIGF